MVPCCWVGFRSKAPMHGGTARPSSNRRASTTYDLETFRTPLQRQATATEYVLCPRRDAKSQEALLLPCGRVWYLSIGHKHHNRTTVDLGSHPQVTGTLAASGRKRPPRSQCLQMMSSRSTSRLTGKVSVSD